MLKTRSPDTPLERADVKTIVHKEGAFSLDDVRLLERLLATPQVGEVRQEFLSLQREASSGAIKPSIPLYARLGIGLYLLGHAREAEMTLTRVSGDAVAAFYRGLALGSLDKHAEAAEQFAEAGKLGYDKVECAMRRAGEIRAQGQPSEAEALLRSIVSEGARRAEYSYQMGCILSDRGDTYGAIEYFERAVDIDLHHSRALFRLAVENASRGNDSEAIRLYERSLSRPPLHLGALINLGLMYEDDQNYPAAAFCFRRVLEVDPTNERAAMYLKDIQAVGEMYYDEDSAREAARMETLLARPISDFELSVRSRNCLEALEHSNAGRPDAGQRSGPAQRAQLWRDIAAGGPRAVQRPRLASRPERRHRPLLGTGLCRRQPLARGAGRRDDAPFGTQFVGPRPQMRGAARLEHGRRTDSEDVRRTPQ